MKVFLSHCFKSVSCNQTSKTPLDVMLILNSQSTCKSHCNNKSNSHSGCKNEQQTLVSHNCKKLGNKLQPNFQNAGLSRLNACTLYKIYKENTWYTRFRESFYIYTFVSNNVESLASMLNPQIIVKNKCYRIA